MEQKDLKSQKSKKSQPEEKQGFFQSLIASLFGSSNPEAELKRRLKTIAKDFSKTKYHIYYKPASFEATPQLAKLFYDIYKIISPAQLMFHNNQNMNVFKHQILNYSLSERQVELLSHFDEKKITEMAQSIPIDKLKVQLENDLNSFISEFDDKKVAKIENLYKTFVYFKDFCSFDYYVILKKFNPSIQENLFDTVPPFEKINAEYIVEGLQDFCTVAYMITNDTLVWTDLFDFLKSTHASEIVGVNNWKKIVAKIRSIQASQAFELMIQHITRKPNYQTIVRDDLAELTEVYLEKIKKDTNATLTKISSQIKKSMATSLAQQIFGPKEIKVLRNYDSAMNETFLKKNLDTFKYAEPLNYLKAFLIEFVKTELREYYDVVVIRGQWDTELSAPFSNAYEDLISVSDNITKLDNSLAENGTIGIKIKTLLPKTAHDSGAENIINRLINDSNEEARMYMLTSTQNMIVLGRTIKQLIEDYMKKKPTLVANWHELEKYIDKPMKDFSVNIYKKIYLFVQLMQQYLNN